MTTRFDAYTGITERMIEQDRKLHVLRSQNVQSILDSNKVERELLPSMHGEAAWRKVASIPNVIAEEWSKECGAAIGSKEFNAYCRRKLMDSDNAAFLIKGY